MRDEQVLFSFSEKLPQEAGPPGVLSAAKLTLAGLEALSEQPLSISMSAEAFSQKQLRTLTRGLAVQLHPIPHSAGLNARLKEALTEPQAESPIQTFLHTFRGLKLSKTSLLATLDDPQSPWRELPCFYEHLIHARTLYVAMCSELFIGSMGEKRSLIESFCRTQVLSREEFMAWCEEMKRSKRKTRNKDGHWSLKTQRRKPSG